MRAHVIKDEKIHNTIEVESLDSLPDMQLVDADIVGGTIGDRFVNGQVLPAEKPTEPGRKITVLAFRRRFTAIEKATIEFAAAHNPFVSTEQQLRQATIRAYLADVATAKHIEPDRDDTRAGVEVLEHFGLLAVGRAAQILDAPIQPHELP